MPTIGLGIITRNSDLEGLKRAVASCLEHVDSVYITVADKEPASAEMSEYASSIGATLSEFAWCDDFAAARNANFALMNDEWMTWCDTDDEVEGMDNARDFLASVGASVHQVLCEYNYGFMPNGNVSTHHPKERFMRNNGMFTWKGKLHETCVSDAKASAIKCDTVIWNHRSTEERSKESAVRNARVITSELEGQIKENKVDPRTVFNLGMAYSSVAQRSGLEEDWKNAVQAFLGYIKLGEWDVHAFMAWKYVGMGHLAMRNPMLARDAFLQCIGLKPQFRDGFVGLGGAFEHMGKLEEAIVAYEMSLGLAENDYASDVGTNVLQPCMGLASCYARLGKRKEALYYCQEAKKVVGDDHEFLNGMESEIKHLDEMFRIGQEHVDRLKTLSPERQKAEYEKLPNEYKSFPLVVQWRKLQDWVYAEPSGRDITIFTGIAWETWNPDSVKTGIGGSEEAVIYLTKELIKLGWNVKCYGNHGTERKSYDGVEYIPYWEWSPREPTDIFIAWRDPSIFDIDIAAKKRYLWLHDTNPEADLTPQRLEKIEKIFVLSKYHRSLYPNTPDEKFMLSANGIVPEQFQKQVERNPKKCFYGSAPDRGLLCLLQMWSKIREQVPDAELYWAYGWNTFDSAARSNPQLQALKAQIVPLLKQPGVHELGRIGHEQVAELMISSALWLYPTMFTEIFCITAIKAQAAGAMPICTNVAALDEVVQDGVKFDVKDIYMNLEAQEKFIKATVKGLKVPIDHDAIRTKAAGRWAWSVVGGQWSKEFEK